MPTDTNSHNHLQAKRQAARTHRNSIGIYIDIASQAKYHSPIHNEVQTYLRISFGW